MFKNHNYNIVNDPKRADIIIINTCGFIDSAKEEAINTILEMAEYKKNNQCKYLIVMGCLVQRYYNDLLKLLPEVDLFIRLDEYDEIWNKIDDLIKMGIVVKSKKRCIKKISEIKPLPMATYEQFIQREISTGKDYAYLKIGEGCSNNCTYCAIPYIRGPFVSRKMEEILDEARILAKKGIKEIIVIAQDTTKYGQDIYGKPMLDVLLDELSKIKEIKWIRFLYSYPEGISDQLINVVKNNKKVVKYFDIPLQHISNNILKRMNRKASKEKIEKLISKIKMEIPEVTLRTSLIVGFPGETKNDFEELIEFVQKAKFDKLGVFMYSKEEGTPAAKLTDQIHGNTKKARYKKIMTQQQKISKENLKKKINKIYDVLIENVSFDNSFFVGRTMQDVPDIDGVVYIKNDNSMKTEELLHKFVRCKIVNIENDYDLIAEIE